MVFLSTTLIVDENHVLSKVNYMLAISINCSYYYTYLDGKFLHYNYNDLGQL